MKLNELITQLLELFARHGDLTVFVVTERSEDLLEAAPLASLDPICTSASEQPCGIVLGPKILPAEIRKDLH